MVILDLFLITIIICFIIDVSGFQDHAIKPLIARYLNRKSTIRIRPEDVIVPKPFSCSLCLTFWAGLIYLLIVHQFTLLNVVIVCGFALMASNISEALQQLKDFISWIQMWVNKILQKLT